MSRSPLLATDSDGGARELVGGKAAGLYRLLALGLPVPPFVVLTTEAYRCSRAGAVGDELPAAVEEALDEAWELLGAGTAALAVRSSAVAEDGGERSYAGQMETFLNVTDRAALSRAVAGCWASLHGERAVAYRAAAGEAHEEAAMAVVLQRLIVPESSGVLFTVNVASGRADELLISSVWGLGEGLVSGALDADTFVLDRGGKVVERRLAEKIEEVRRQAGGGTETVPVAADRAARPSLDEATLARLASHALDAEASFGRPLDVEFAVVGGELFFLQARPVTGFLSRPRPEDGNRQVWDNSNIVESYPGITLPLTFSFIRRAYHSVYWQFCEVLGLGEEEIRRHDHMLRNMLGLIRGRVYYNLLNWYRLVALLPGFSFNRQFMEGMMGVGESLAPEESSADGFRGRRLGALSKLLRTGLRAVGLHLSLGGRVERFHREFDAAHARFSAIDYAELEPAEVLGHYRAMEREVLWKWKAPIINDFSVMIFHGALKKLTAAWRLDEEGTLTNALLSAQGEIESTEVVDRLRDLAAEIAADRGFRPRFAAAEPAEALALLRQHPVHGPPFEAYLERYGDRSIAELKLESRSMRDDPRFCVSMVQSYLDLPPRAESASAAAGRVAAEAMLARRLGGLRRWPRRRLYRWVLGHARRGIRQRENQRLARTRAFAVARRMFRAIGSRFRQDGLLTEAEEVFYLRLEEIADFVDGTASDLDLRGRVEAARRQYEAFAAEAPPPDRFETWGSVGLAHPTDDGALDGDSEAGHLDGLGAFPGVVERPAAVVFEPDPSLRLSGEILVTRQTDPGWVVLFPSISGLVVERGSLLSHSAIVAREMGIPAVVGVRGATRRIETGDLLRLDGGRGRVEVLAGGEPSADGPADDGLAAGGPLSDGQAGREACDGQAGREARDGQADDGVGGGGLLGDGPGDERGGRWAGDERSRVGERMRRLTRPKPEGR